LTLYYAIFSSKDRVSRKPDQLYGPDEQFLPVICYEDARM